MFVDTPPDRATPRGSPSSPWIRDQGDQLAFSDGDTIRGDFTPDDRARLGDVLGTA
jgi:hypothetical protein